MQKTPGKPAPSQKKPVVLMQKNPPQLAPLQKTPVTVWNVPTVAKNPYYRRKKPQPLFENQCLLFQTSDYSLTTLTLQTDQPSEEQMFFRPSSISQPVSNWQDQKFIPRNIAEKKTWILTCVPLHPWANMLRICGARFKLGFGIADSSGLAGFCTA